MLAGRNRFSAPTVTSEGPFPLGPFPRYIWIHSNTPQDSLDEVCHEIWKRVQQLSGELQPPSLVPLLPHGLCPPPPGTPRRDNVTYSINPLLDEPAGLQSIYREMLGNREREMKLRALCDAQLSAKSVITSLLSSAKPHRNPKGLGDGSVSGPRSTEGSKAEVPFLPKYPDPAKGSGNQGPAEETKAGKELVKNSTFSSAKTTTAGPPRTAAESPAMEKKQQVPPFAEIHTKTDSDVATKNPVTTATPDKKIVKYNACASGFSTTSMTTALNQPVWQSLSFPPFSVFPNHSNFPHFQGPYHQRARMPYQQAPYPSFGCYLRQVAPYSPQQIFQPPYAPMLNYIPLVQPGYPYQQRTPPTPSSTIPHLSPMAGDGIQYPFSPSYGFNSTPGGTVTINLNYFSSENHVKF
ncbi:PREDICTED: uncharacterized protein C1orf94 homolog [Calidris pugnax]|uniref:uncharacterized protein C1orf94 homolog n=1 Tax=Calidris pugnax TaxID=198806 RepID=UPI00071E38FB|nr:PREDICTED: uncharacterized protein C1orf94 homolog [Calidris pugnax]